VAREPEHGQAEAGHLARKSDAGFDELALDEPVDKADTRGLLRLDRAAG
jgi:hypothetical protein